MGQKGVPVKTLKHLRKMGGISSKKKRVSPAKNWDSGHLSYNKCYMLEIFYDIVDPHMM